MTRQTQQDRKTQRDRILSLLETHGPDGVTAQHLSHYALSYTRRIYELRKLGHIIEMLDSREGRMRRTRYQLIRKAEAA